MVRPVTFGLHVHVGVDSGDKAIRIGHRIQRYLPILLAMSANSPFWQGRATGHHAHRIEVLEGFPTGGMMPALGTWAEFLELLGQMQAAGFVESHRELWWDVRPNAENGTIEVRICDMPADLPDVLGLTATIQCLVQSLSEEIDRGTKGSVAPAPDPPESVAGLPLRNRGRVGDPGTAGARPARGRRFVDPPVRGALDPARLSPADRTRGPAMTGRPTGSERQLLLHREVGDLAEVVRRLAGRSRLSAEPAEGPGFFGRTGGWAAAPIRPALPPGVGVT